MNQSTDQNSKQWRGRSFSEPFAFRAQLRRPDTRIDFIPVLDLIVIAMLFSLLFTRFVTMPGVRVDLPTTTMRMQNASQSVAVLTIGNNGMLFFDGAVFELRTIDRAFEDYIEDGSREKRVLLIKAHPTMDMQEFFRLCELAKTAGFDQVQLAGRQDVAVEELLPPTG